MNHSNPQQLYIASFLYVRICARWLLLMMMLVVVVLAVFQFQFSSVYYLFTNVMLYVGLSFPFSVRHTLLAVVVIFMFFS